MKKSNSLDKILKVRLTDTSLKMFFFSTTALVVGAVGYLLYQTDSLKSSVESMSKQKSITIIDESGTIFKKKLYETNQDIATIFAITYAKKSLGYGYLNFNDIYNFVKVFSSKEVVNKYEKIVKTSLQQLKILNATYKTKIIKYKMENKPNSNKNFDFIAIIEQKLVSPSEVRAEKLLVKLEVEFNEPTDINSSGIFVTSSDITKYNSEEHDPYFEKQ